MAEENNNNNFVNNYDSYWTAARNHNFEILSYTIPEDAPDRYEQMASHFRGRTVAELRQRDMFLANDMAAARGGYLDLQSQPSGSIGQLRRTRARNAPQAPWTAREIEYVLSSFYFI